MSIFDGNANPSRTQVTRPRLYHIFEASREQIRAAENGERHVLQMLPAYVNIQLTEYGAKLVQTVNTVKQALDILLKRWILRKINTQL